MGKLSTTDIYGKMMNDGLENFLWKFSMPQTPSYNINTDARFSVYLWFHNCIGKIHACPFLDVGRFKQNKEFEQHIHLGIDPMNDGRQRARPGEGVDLGPRCVDLTPFVQSIEMPMIGSTQQTDFDTILGTFQFNQFSPWSSDGKQQVTLHMIDTEYCILDAIFYPWLKMLGTNKWYVGTEQSLELSLTPYPIATLQIFTPTRRYRMNPNADPVAGGNAEYTYYSFNFIGARPFQYASPEINAQGKTNLTRNLIISSDLFLVDMDHDSVVHNHPEAEDGNYKVLADNNKPGVTNAVPGKEPQPSTPPAQDSNPDPSDTDNDNKTNADTDTDKPPDEVTPDPTADKDRVDREIESQENNEPPGENTADAPTTPAPAVNDPAAAPSEGPVGAPTEGQAPPAGDNNQKIPQQPPATGMSKREETTEPPTQYGIPMPGESDDEYNARCKRNNLINLHMADQEQLADYIAYQTKPYEQSLDPNLIGKHLVEPLTISTDSQASDSDKVPDENTIGFATNTAELINEIGKNSIKFAVDIDILSQASYFNAKPEDVSLTSLANILKSCISDYQDTFAESGESTRDSEPLISVASYQEVMGFLRNITKTPVPTTMDEANLLGATSIKQPKDEEVIHTVVSSMRDALFNAYHYLDSWESDELESLISEYAIAINKRFPSNSLTNYLQRKTGIWWTGMYLRYVHNALHEALNIGSEIKQYRKGREFILRYQFYIRELSKNDKYVIMQDILGEYMEEQNERNFGDWKINDVAMWELVDDYNNFTGTYWCKIHLFNKLLGENGTGRIAICKLNYDGTVIEDPLNFNNEYFVAAGPFAITKESMNFNRWNRTSIYSSDDRFEVRISGSNEKYYNPETAIIQSKKYAKSYETIWNGSARELIETPIYHLEELDDNLERMIEENVASGGLPDHYAVILTGPDAPSNPSIYYRVQRMSAYEAFTFFEDCSPCAKVVSMDSIIHKLPNRSNLLYFRMNNAFTPYGENELHDWNIPTCTTSKVDIFEAYIPEYLEYVVQYQQHNRRLETMQLEQGKMLNIVLGVTAKRNAIIDLIQQYKNGITSTAKELKEVINLYEQMEILSDTYNELLESEILEEDNLKRSRDTYEAVRNRYEETDYSELDKYIARAEETHLNQLSVSMSIKALNDIRVRQQEVLLKYGDVRNNLRKLVDEKHDMISTYIRLYRIYLWGSIYIETLANVFNYLDKFYKWRDDRTNKVNGIVHNFRTHIRQIEEMGSLDTATLDEVIIWCDWIATFSEDMTDKENAWRMAYENRLQKSEVLAEKVRRWEKRNNRIEKENENRTKLIYNVNYGLSDNVVQLLTESEAKERKDDLANIIQDIAESKGMTWEEIQELKGKIGKRIFAEKDYYEDHADSDYQGSSDAYAKLIEELKAKLDSRLLAKKHYMENELEKEVPEDIVQKIKEMVGDILNENWVTIKNATGKDTACNVQQLKAKIGQILDDEWIYITGGGKSKGANIDDIKNKIGDMLSDEWAYVNSISAGDRAVDIKLIKEQIGNLLNEKWIYLKSSPKEEPIDIDKLKEQIGYIVNERWIAANVTSEKKFTYEDIQALKEKIADVLSENWFIIWGEYGGLEKLGINGLREKIGDAAKTILYCLTDENRGEKVVTAEEIKKTIDEKALAKKTYPPPPEVYDPDLFPNSLHNVIAIYRYLDPSFANMTEAEATDSLLFLLAKPYLTNENPEFYSALLSAKALIEQSKNIYDEFMTEVEGETKLIDETTSKINKLNAEIEYTEKRIMKLLENRELAPREQKKQAKMAILRKMELESRKKDCTNLLNDMKSHYENITKATIDRNKHRLEHYRQSYSDMLEDLKIRINFEETIITIAKSLG